MAVRTTACCIAGALALVAADAGAEDAPADKKKEPPPEEGIARPEAEDLRHGHLLLGLSGGVWLPTAPFAPALDELGSLDVGGTAHAHLGIGLGRYLALGLDGGFAHLPSLDTACASCGATSIDAGASLAFHPMQGFAMDPWASVGMAYRHTFLHLEQLPSTSLAAWDFLRLGLGAEYRPVGLFGFGPYIEVDVSVREFAPAIFFAVFQAGLRVTFDPFQAGTSFTPGMASAK